MSQPRSSRKDVFEAVYHNHTWGGESRSGPGSDPLNTVAYIGFINRWLAAHPDCKHIVEIGCGDWATSQLINLTSIQTYTGYDIVPEVIARNVATHQSSQVQFVCADFLEEPPVEGDLLIVKDVLQHLSNASVFRFIQQVLPRYRYAIIVNDVRRFQVLLFLGVPVGWKNIQIPNADVSDGGSRPIRLDSPPFLLPVAERFSYKVILRQNPTRVIYIKDVLVWAR